MKKHKIVKIVWEDASYLNPYWWDESEDSVAVDIITSIGFLLFKNAAVVKISQTIAEDGDYGGIFLIPAKTIKSIKVIG